MELRVMLMIQVGEMASIIVRTLAEVDWLLVGWLVLGNEKSWLGIGGESVVWPLSLGQDVEMRLGLTFWIIRE